jgi:hypothetical protein
MMSTIETLIRSSRRAALRRLGAGGLATALAGGGLGRTTGAVKAAPLPEIILEWFGAWTSDDTARDVAALYAADGTYEDVATGAYILAPDIEGYLPSAPVRPATVNRYLRGSFAVDRFAVAEQLFYATNQSFAPGAPAGAPFEVFAVTLFEYDDQTLHRSADYYDFGSILRQVGIPSTTSSPGDPCQAAERSGSSILRWA